MKPIFYRVKGTNKCFKLVPVDNMPKKELDNFLDSIGDKDIEFITEKEFEQNKFRFSYDKWMEIDVMDSENKFKIAALITRQI